MSHQELLPFSGSWSSLKSHTGQLYSNLLSLCGWWHRNTSCMTHLDSLFILLKSDSSLSLPKARGNMEKPVIICLILNTAKSPGGPECCKKQRERERVNIYNKSLLCPHTGLPIQVKQWSLFETWVFVEFNHMLHWTEEGEEGIPLCWMCREGGGGM